jgi:hypothetical protein
MQGAVEDISGKIRHFGEFGAKRLKSEMRAGFGVISDVVIAGAFL